MNILIAIGVNRRQEAGAAGVALNHARELEKRGHTVDCWFLDEFLKGGSESSRFSALNFSWAVARRILRGDRKYDVVNIHAPWGCVYGAWRKWLRPQNAPPLVFTMQGSEERFVYAMRREYDLGRAENFSWKNRAWHRLYYQTMYDYAITTAAHGAVANREAWLLAQLKYGLAPDRVWFVPNGVEECFFTERVYRPSDPLRLLFVGTWIDRKGVFYLAEAFAKLCETDSAVTLSVAGCFSAADTVLRAFPSSCRDRVQVLPFISREDIPAVYAFHHVFVFPSLVEGMPLSLLEAMASGMPVVTAENSGMTDLIEDEFDGLLVKSGDSIGLAAALERLAASPELRRSLGQAAQQKAYRYTWSAVVDKLERVLQLAVDRGNRL